MTLLDELLAIPSAEVAEWPEKEQLWFHEMLSRETALRSPADFAVTHSNGRWMPYRHSVFTSDAIVDMTEHDSCDLLLVDQPVRHGKSELCSKWTPAWAIAKKRWPVLLSSYESTFAEKWGGDVRAIINEVGPLYGLKIRDDTRAKARWELEGGLGGMNTAGAGGPITGKGGKLLICDDPIKGREQAMSPAERKKLKEWWDTVWITRRVGGEGPGTKYLLIMSRWHIDDLMGWLLSRADEMGMRMIRLRMPAIAEDDDVLGRRPGEALCPELFNEQALEAIKKDSPLGWPSLYQQRPVPEGGGLFKRDNFATFTRQTIDGDEYFKLDERMYRRDECTVFATMDTAYTKTRRSDFTAVGVWAVTPNDPGDLLLLKMYRRRVDHAEHGPLIEEAWRDWSPRWVGLERITATYALFAEAQRAGVVVRWLNPDRNKIARAEPAMAMSENGRVWTDGTSDAIDFIEECTTFPNGEHDDQVDVFAYAAAEVYKRAVRARHRTREPDSYEDRVWKQLQKASAVNQRHPVLGRW
jgi:predicted phage terminase large subunit-like protein